MTDTINDIILTEAKKSEGTWEWAGDEHNPKVLAMYADAGHPEIRNDEVPWCAAFVGSVLAKVGIRNTGSLLAKSYLKWGEDVEALAFAEPGDVVVLHRGTKSWQGHVGFLIKYDAHHVWLLGGNQGNQVNVTPYPIFVNGENKLAGIRRAKRPKSSVAQSRGRRGRGNHFRRYCCRGAERDGPDRRGSGCGAHVGCVHVDFP